MAGQAGWVMHWADSGEPLVVIEAKGPFEPSGPDVRRQARSYAFALSAPYHPLVDDGAWSFGSFAGQATIGCCPVVWRRSGLTGHSWDAP